MQHYSSRAKNDVSAMTKNYLSLQPPSCLLLQMLPSELHLNILTYLRAYDLSAIQVTCRYFADRHLIHNIVQHTAVHVYPPSLTAGFDTPIVSGTTAGPLFTLENLRNMELLVVARVLSQPEPTSGFYVSKSWCRTALRWLEVQQQDLHTAHSKKKKLSKKQQRIRSRRLSDVSPPWPNVNSDLLCAHQNLQRCQGNKASRAKRRLLDKQAWKVLKKLYPDSKPLDSTQGECLQCILEDETAKKNEADRLERERLERKRPLSCPYIRAFYTRTRGVPLQSLQQTGKCPLQPGQYHILPRSWCHRWRKYLKTGEGGEKPCAPCASLLLCDAHRLPLIPPHLESYLYGQTSVLWASTGNGREDLESAAASTTSPPFAAFPVGMDPDDDTMQILRAAGLSPAELASQRLAMMSFLDRAVPQPPTAPPSKDMLDRENSVVAEVLTHDEYVALEKWWPQVHSNFNLVCTVNGAGNVAWSTPPCRDCDPTGRCHRSDLCVKNRQRNWVKKSSEQGHTPASLEY